ncbi:MAG: A24 family peptidase [Candidatus Diapherotrites archaeon]|nr:A24 family peptidase [Candidatus Diapherotrites archaeon]
MTDLLLIREIVLLLGLILASYFDIRKRIIPDKLNYALAGFGIILNFFDFNWIQFIFPVFVFAFFAVIYYLGKIGGGDVKLFTATAFLLPIYNNQFFLIPALFYSALISVIFLSVYYVLKYMSKGIDWNENKKGIQQAVVLGLFLVVYAGVFYFWGKLNSSMVILFFVPLLFGLVFMAFQQGIKKHFFLKQVQVSALEEDEVIAKEFLPISVSKNFNFSVKGIVTEEDKQKLKELNILEVPIYRDLPPFAPFFLMGCILAFGFPSLLNDLFFFSFFAFRIV